MGSMGIHRLFIYISSHVDEPEAVFKDAFVADDGSGLTSVAKVPCRAPDF